MTKYLDTDSNCFACGKNNPRGLKLKFAQIESHVEAHFDTVKDFEGWDNIIHGGIVSTLLDEAMSHAVFKLLGGTVVTAEMCVRFVKPTKVGQTVVVKGYIDCDKGRIIETSAQIVDGKGEVLAKATGRFFKVNDKQKLEYS